MAKDWSNQATVVYYRTYSREMSNYKRENWFDTVSRVVRGNTRNHNVSEVEKNALTDLMMNRKATSGGRGLWFSGSPNHERLGGVAMTNCWGLTSEDWMNFVIAQDLLMLGGGVGMTVEHRYTSKLSMVKKGVNVVHKATKDADFIVPDSREGWNELLRRTLESFLVTGRSFSYSTVCVRPADELIKGFGGISSGPGPLIILIDKLNVLFKCREGKRIRPLDAADILCCIGEMVVSGNVRRSALLILGDCWDKDYLKAKRWDLGLVPNHRATANFSVVCDDIEDLHPLFWKTYEHGEPFGIINRTNIQTYGRMGEKKKDTAIVVNPCQPGWATLLTPKGISDFDGVEVGSVIWSGKRWTTITKKVCTGEKQVFAFRTSAGVFYGTENHRIVQDGEKIEVGQASAIDITTGPNMSSLVQLNPQDIMDGLVLGDGMTHKASNNLNVLLIGENDQSYFKSEIADLIGRHRAKGFKEPAWEITTTLGPLPRTYERKIPQKFVHGDSEQVRAFLRGLYSANGSVVDNRVTLKCSSRYVIDDTQRMLSSLGIPSYVTTNKSHDVEFSNGVYTCKESYDLNVGTLQGRQIFAASIGFIQPYKTDKLLSICQGKNRRAKQTFDIVEKELIGTEPVYDITVEADEHTYWTGGLLVSNCSEATLEAGPQSSEGCNLLEEALPNFKDEAEFIFASRLMMRYGKRVSLEKYHWPGIEEIAHRNMRVGIGITGCLQSPLFNPKTLDAAYDAILDEDRKVSQEYGVDESIRHTVVKPSGTLSKLFDMEGYEGIHAPPWRYMIQRIRFGSNDPLLPLLRQAGHKMEPAIRFDGSIDPNTVVVDFYQKAPDGAPVVEEGWNLQKQLDTLLMAQRHWSDQAVSVTIYYRKEEIPTLKAWLADNLKNLKTVSFLCYNDHGFVQAPKEGITKEQYEQLAATIKPVKIEDAGTGDIDSLECAGGACPIK